MPPEVLFDIPESPEVTVKRFIGTWREKPQRIVPELLGVSKETNRLPDVYHYLVIDDQLIDPEEMRPVLDFTSPGVEQDITVKMQNWAADNDEGIAWWISPRWYGVHPDDKVIIHQIAYDLDGNKVVMNSSINFSADLENTDELRQILFTAEDNDRVLQDILLWVEEVSGRKPKEATKNQEGTALAYYFAKKIMLGINDNLIVDEMQRTGFLGPAPIDCVGGACSLQKPVFFTKKSISTDGKVVDLISNIRCKFCSSNVEAEVSNGEITCKSCKESAKVPDITLVAA